MTSTVIYKLCKEIKALLISTDQSKQQNGLDRLHIIINSYEKTYPLIFEHLIDADLIEILCDKLSTVNSTFILSVLHCIELILNSKCLMKAHQLMCICESVLRTLQMSVKRVNNAILSQGCIILSLVIRRSVDTKLDCGYFCDGELFILINNIMENGDSSCIENAIELLIHIMVVIVQYKIEDIDKELVVGTLTESINYLCQNINHTNSFQKLSKLIILSFKFISCDSQNKTNQSFTEAMLKVLNEKFITPLMRVELNNIGEDLSLVIRTILSAYLLEDNAAKHSFSVHLMSINFIETLQNIEMISKDEPQYLLIRSLLYEILVCLSSNELGSEDWQTILKNGLLRLPFRDSFTSLKNKDEAESTLIIIFNYFKLLPYFRPTVNKTYSMEINSFILNLKKPPCESLMKAIWFEFAAAQLNYEEMKDYGNRTAKMLIRLLKNYNPRSTYTHHPVLLKWTFSDVNIEAGFKRRVLRTWLEKNDSISQQAISVFLINNQQAFPVFLELIASKELGSLVEKIMSQFMLELRKSDADVRRKFIEETWLLLPHILATFSPITKQRNIKNIANIFLICKENISENLDRSVLLSISCHLPSVIIQCYQCSAKSDISDVSNADNIATLIQCFQFASIIIKLAANKRDERVLIAFLHHQNFLVTLGNCFSTIDDKDMLSSLLELFAYMLQFQLQSNIESTEVIELETAKIISLLCDEILVSIAGLRLLASYLQGFVDSRIKLFIQLPAPTAVQLTALYIRIHMICAQANDEVCCWCWICLRYLLKLSQKFNLHFHLGTLYYTQNLLVNCSPKSKSWTEMLNFLPSWLSLLPPTNRRVFTLSSTQRTITELARNFFTQGNHYIDPKLRCALFKILKIEAMSALFQNNK